MSEEQLKAAETEATAQVEGMEEISEEDLAGVAGGNSFGAKVGNPQKAGNPLGEPAPGVRYNF